MFLLDEFLTIDKIFSITIKFNSNKVEVVSFH